MKALRFLLPLVLIFQSCVGWGDFLNRPKHLIGNYYLLEQENARYGISYKVDGGFRGRNPMHSHVLRYAISDSLLLMQVEYGTDEIEYYVINMQKDGAFAEATAFEVLNVPDDAFLKSGLAGLNLDFRKVD